MDEIQVDPKLFVTCRLCLEDLGQYQIVPSVQQQIKYCFDIDVQPFDGLPQLVCSKCKEILNRFHTIKTTFCEKQTDLRTKVIKKDEVFCIQPQQDTVSSSQQAPETIEPHPSTNPIINEPCNSKKKKSKRKRLFLNSSSSSDSESVQSFQTTKSHKKRSPRRKGKIPMPWEADYKKMISCKLCNSVWSSKKALAVHNRSHELLRERYKNILNQQCTVNLIKIDDKPNLTGLNNMVVHSNKKIIESGNSPYFSTIYSKDDVESSTSDFQSDDVHNKDKNKSSSQDSSDDEERIVCNPTQRKRRIMSRSSNETVVIESNSNKVLSDEEDSKSAVRKNIDRLLNNEQCINIDDSSESESDQGILEKSGNLKQPVEATLNDYKIIQGILSMCVNSCLTNNESSEVDMLYMNVNQNKKKCNVSNESQLIHKVLSIGRKIINKQGFNCTGLLRYMEQKNLGIVWIAKPQPLWNSKDTNYIRILAKLRGDPILDDETGWVKASQKTEKKPSSLPSIKKSVKKAAPNKPPSNFTASSDVTDSTNIATNMLANTETSQPEPINNQVKLDSMPAMLSYVDSKASISDSKKLLNANPVANPKQLPKKLGPGNESRSNKTVVQQTVVCQPPPTNDDTNYCLPIITSTTSLATIPSKEQTQDANQKNTVTSEEISKSETPAAPRIKVKPASELMSERTLGIMKEQSVNVTDSNMFVRQMENVRPYRPNINVFVPNIAPQTLVTSPPLLLPMPTLNAVTTFQPVPGPITSNTKRDYVILDTTDFPNTKTDSPIRYVKDLLQLHNIFLLDPNDAISSNFICLIKFKVVFKQDYQRDSPLILCLSLSSLKNTFCFHVRDINQDTLDMKNISANWQWEILQTYRGDVSDKVLQNARKYGQEAFDLTNKFFCLLKSINCRKP